MCGITGAISKNNITSDERNDVLNMSEKLSHRGPNSTGVFSSEKVEMRMKRLSIIDILGGEQPLYNEDKSIILIANGEIYNFIELRKKLIKKGHHFKTKSDCETIIHAYEEYGENGFISHLRGMFAFCIYDLNLNKVIIARDRLGEKPLYYFTKNECFFFSSEMKSILEAFPKEMRVLNKDQIYNYFLYQYIPEPYTLFNGINKLAAGHYITITLSDWNFNINKYWDIEDVEMIENGKYEEIVREELKEIDKIIIRSDVPVGISLSGGIDSSVIAILASRYNKKQMHAFSVGYPGYPVNDERLAAEHLASKLNLEFHSVEIKTNELLEDFSKLIYDMDDPIADIAAYGYYRIFKEAKEKNVPVMLAGFGGDELFWGYEWTRKAARYNSLKKNIVTKFILTLILLKEYRMRLKKNFFDTIIYVMKLAITNKTLLYEFTSSWRKTKDDEKKIFNPLFLSELNNEKEKKENKKVSSGVKVTAKLTLGWLASNCVALGDRLSMAHSIEIRLPFLDYRLYEKIIGLRKKYIKDYTQGYKHLLIEATKDILPQNIINRKKQGFNPPTEEWMKKLALKYETLLKNGILVKECILEKSYIEYSLDPSHGKMELIYKILVLEIWLKHFYE